jgi:hypothetical protein
MTRISTIVPIEIGRYITAASAGLGFCDVWSWSGVNVAEGERKSHCQDWIKFGLRFLYRSEPFHTTIGGIPIAIAIRRGWLSE